MAGIVGNALQQNGSQPPQAAAAPGLPPATPAAKQMILAASQIVYGEETTKHIMDWMKTHSDKAKAAGHLAVLIMREMMHRHAKGAPPPSDVLRATIVVIQMILELAAKAGLCEDTPELRVQALHDAIAEQKAYKLANPGSTLDAQQQAPMAAAPVAAPVGQ